MRKEGERASAAADARTEEEEEEERCTHAEPAAVVRSGSCTNTDISFVIM